MTHHDGHRTTPERPAETAADEVFEEAEDAATRRPGDERDPDKDGEAGDALTPNAEAQRDAHRHDQGKHGQGKGA
ncbi:hypothetical protein [Streptomyces sp. G45]|uniref:hypothetical protein n=1 Tax=Streptomyces sp. G45 TaxID=3406627 RepID=UPI003C1D4A8C